MRVVAGKARGLKLNTIEQYSTRPTKDMVKEALFSMLQDYVQDSIFLDLFAGSGAIGIEAISRGAQKAYFVDVNKDCVKVINENIKKAKFEEFSEVYNLDYEKALDKFKNIQFDLIYIDPPYNIGLGIKSIEKITSLDLLKRNGVLVYETDEVEISPDTIENLEKFKTKKYGRNILNFYRRKE